ncbi:hypothetical protein JCM39194_06070 [Desulfotomaculum varum]|uniref:4Fe-4S dicluster domain-containing protein n=1 Tax=Desulforamulus hydrothermalis TaxID=412895 RepID=UPI0003042A5E|nr:4Fe-4S binding protein [Desulforamulus hydrothermalis]
MTDLSLAPGLRPATVTVNQAWCKKCGICIAFCSKGVLAFSAGNRLEVVRPDSCVACGLCESFCPDYAITLEVAEQ